MAWVLPITGKGINLHGRKQTQVTQNRWNAVYKVPALFNLAFETISQCEEYKYECIYKQSIHIT